MESLRSNNSLVSSWREGNSMGLNKVEIKIRTRMPFIIRHVEPNKNILDINKHKPARHTGISGLKQRNPNFPTKRELQKLISILKIYINKYLHT